MTDKKSFKDDASSEIDILYDRLLFDENFQQMRKAVLESIPKDKQNLLSAADQNYLNQTEPPQWIEEKIAADYAKQLEKMDNTNTHSWLAMLKLKLSLLNLSHPFLISGSLVSMGLILGLLLPNLFQNPKPSHTDHINSVDKSSAIATEQKGNSKRETEQPFPNVQQSPEEPQKSAEPKRSKVATNTFDNNNPASQGELANKHSNQSTHSEESNLRVIDHASIENNLENYSPEAMKTLILEELTKTAENGDANAQNKLGDAYQYGQGVEQDYLLASSWYQKAADQGHSIAQYNLSIMYSQGIGVEADQDKALLWFNQARDSQQAINKD